MSLDRRAHGPSVRPVDKPKQAGSEAARDWIAGELEDSRDEDYELELSETPLSEEIAKIYGRKQGPAPAPSMGRPEYFGHLLTLQAELIKLQTWVAHTGAKIVVLFEGRDSAGKGGVIKRITQRLNPRVCRVVALPAPTEREKTQVVLPALCHAPARRRRDRAVRPLLVQPGRRRAGDGVRQPEQVEQFFHDVPEFERMLVRSGIVLLKYWFSITDQEQQLRFLMRIHDPMKQWKLSPMDLESRVRWEDYTQAKEEMLERTNIPEARWFIVEGNDKRRARLNCIDHLLKQVPYTTCRRRRSRCPERVFDPDYERKTLPPELYVPNIYG